MFVAIQCKIGMYLLCKCCECKKIKFKSVPLHSKIIFGYFSLDIINRILLRVARQQQFARNLPLEI